MNLATSTDYVKMSQIWLPIYEKDITRFQELMRNKRIAFSLFESAYFQLIRDKKIQPIETLAQEEKESLFRMAITWAPAFAQKDNTRLCRIIHCIYHLQKIKTQ